MEWNGIGVFYRSSDDAVQRKLDIEVIRKRGRRKLKTTGRSPAEKIAFGKENAINREK